jgi:hypothetical protein
LQGKTNFVPNLFGLVQCFKPKLTLLEEHLGKGELHHFTRMPELMAETKIQDFTKFIKQVSLLKQSIEKRFTDFREDIKNVQLFISFFNFIYRSCCLCSSPPSGSFIVNNKITWHCMENLRKYVLGNPSSPKFTSFWKLLPKTDFPNLIEFAPRYSCRFGSTYICEQRSSTMNFIKNKYRAVLTDEHLKNFILLGSSQIDPNIEKLTQMKQIQRPH